MIIDRKKRIKNGNLLISFIFDSNFLFDILKKRKLPELL